MTSQFYKSREVGNQASHLLAEIIRFNGAKVYEVPNGYHPDFDLKINEKRTVEVKWNTTAHKTGNFALELNTLHHSKADLLAIAYGNPIKAYYLAPLKEVREFADKYPVKKWIGTPKEECAIVPRRMFFEKLKPSIIEM